MAGYLTKSDEKRLKDTGLWAGYNEHTQYLRSTGKAIKEAKTESLALYLPRAEIIKKSFTPAAIGVSREGDKPENSLSSLIEIPEHIMDAPHDIVASVEYVAKYLSIGLNQDNVKDAPCAAAVSMLKSYSASPARKNLFWDKIHILTMPQKSDMEKKDKQSFDGEVIQKMAMEIVGQMEKYKEKEHVES